MLNHHWSRAACLLLASLALVGSAEASVFKKEGTPDEQRAEIRKVSDQALAELYKAQPSARAHIQKAAGYAVFSNFGLKILVAGGGSGRGIAVGYTVTFVEHDGGHAVPAGVAAQALAWSLG